MARNKNVDINKKDPIRANRLSNREVLFTSMSIPSSSSSSPAVSPAHQSLITLPPVTPPTTNKTNYSTTIASDQPHDYLVLTDVPSSTRAERDGTKFDEDDFIKTFLEKLNKNNDDIGNNSDDEYQEDDNRLSEYERNVLNKYLKEVNDESGTNSVNNGNDGLCDKAIYSSDPSSHSVLVGNVDGNATSNVAVNDTSSSRQNCFNQIKQFEYTNNDNNQINKVLFDNNNDANDDDNNNHNNRPDDNKRANVTYDRFERGSSHSHDRNRTGRIFTSNMSILVGVTSAVWGIFFYIVKTYVN